MNFGDLENDTVIKEKITKVHNNVEKIKGILEVFKDKTVYDKLEPLDKVDYDLFLSYTLNTLYWMYLRTKGMDPNKNDVKNEINRVREYMLKAKEAKDRKTIRPILNKEATKRFVRNAMFDADKPPNKKIKFTYDDE